MSLAKFFGMMVASDGVEPPTPAFSEQLQWLSWDCQTLENTSTTHVSWVIAVGDFTAH
jgi:hypothetical protein